MPLPRHPPQKAAAAAFRPYPPARGTPMLPGATARAVAMAAAEAPPGAGPGQWLGQSEAARRLGWHLERVRAAARRGRLQRRKGNAGQWLIFVPDRLAAGADRGSSQGADPAYDSVDALGAAGLVAGLRDELADLHGAVPEAAERARADRLEAALAEARRPLLLRLLDGLRRR